MTHDPSTLMLRRISLQDQAFLFQVYASTRVQELEQVAWSQEIKTVFLQQQFDAQHHHYQTYFDGADFLVILLHDHPVGRLYVGRYPDEIRIIDIAILPEYRNAGIGSRLIQQLLDEGRASGKPVRIHVEKFNPALRLYQRLGFSPIADKEVYWFMEWTPHKATQIQQGA